MERDSQKGIVVGKGGQKIKDVGVDARKELEEFLQGKVRCLCLVWVILDCVVTVCCLSMIFLLV